MRFESSNLTPGEIESLRPRVMILRLVVIALAAGVAVFGGVAVAMAGMRVQWPPAMLSMVLAALGFLVLAQGILLPRMIRGRITLESADRGERLSRLSTLWISTGLVGVALIESAAFLNGVAVLLEGNAVNAGLMALCFLAIFLYYPTLDRLLDWMEPRIRDRA